jgi:hypothetical protein
VLRSRSAEQNAAVTLDPGMRRKRRATDADYEARRRPAHREQRHECNALFQTGEGHWAANGHADDGARHRVSRVLRLACDEAIGMTA